MLFYKKNQQQKNKKIFIYFWIKILVFVRILPPKAEMSIYFTIYIVCRETKYMSPE